ncbi:MAG TPA: hypothetical protein VIX12_01210 [Candidatus Binataceae bacterium]
MRDCGRFFSASASCFFFFLVSTNIVSAAVQRAAAGPDSGSIPAHDLASIVRESSADSENNASVDLVIAIPRGGHSYVVLDEVREKMHGVIATIGKQRTGLRVGVISYGDTDEPLKIQELTDSIPRVQSFVGSIGAEQKGGSHENVLGAIEAAVERMRWRKDSLRMIVLAADSAPESEEISGAMELARTFRSENGILNSVDLTPEIDRLISESSGRPSLLSIDVQTRGILETLAAIGGGALSTF